MQLDVENQLERVTEAITEAAQERTQIAAAGLASPLQTTSPYEQEEINKRLRKELNYVRETSSRVS